MGRRPPIILDFTSVMKLFLEVQDLANKVDHLDAKCSRLTKRIVDMSEAQSQFTQNLDKFIVQVFDGMKQLNQLIEDQAKLISEIPFKLDGTLADQNKKVLAASKALAAGLEAAMNTLPGTDVTGPDDAAPVIPDPAPEVHPVDPQVETPVPPVDLPVDTTVDPVTPPADNAETPAQ